MSFLQVVQSYSGLVSMIFVIASAVFYARYSSKSKANNTATEAQEKAMNAMELRLNVLEKNISDLTKENVRLHTIFDAIKAALKSMGMVVTIDGEMVSIHNGNNSVTTRIRENIDNRMDHE